MAIYFCSPNFFWILTSHKTKKGTEVCVCERERELVNGKGKLWTRFCQVVGLWCVVVCDSWSQFFCWTRVILVFPQLFEIVTILPLLLVPKEKNVCILLNRNICQRLNLYLKKSRQMSQCQNLENRLELILNFLPLVIAKWVPYKIEIFCLSHG